MWGYQLRVDAARCNSNRSDNEKISLFAEDIVKQIGMTSYGDPWVVYFGKDNPSVAGFTLTQLMETSNITAHFCDYSGECYFDIWSCKPYNVQKALKCIEQWFSPAKYTYKYDERQAPQIGDD